MTTFCFLASDTWHGTIQIKMLTFLALSLVLFSLYAAPHPTITTLENCFGIITSYNTEAEADFSVMQQSETCLNHPAEAYK